MVQSKSIWQGLLVKVYVQIFGVYYTDTFAPVARLDTIILLINVFARGCLNVYQMDVKLAILMEFLNKKLMLRNMKCFLWMERNIKSIDYIKALYVLELTPRSWI